MNKEKQFKRVNYHTIVNNLLMLNMFIMKIELN